MKKISILFVCLGNICRSPIAEGVFRKKAEAANLHNSIEIDSAGTAAWHAGNPPDTRMIEAAKERGYDITNLRARQVNQNDFSKFDYILAMDDENLMDLEDVSPEGTAANLKLFLDYANGAREHEVPDPYFGGADGFYHVIELVESASDGLIKEILAEHQS